MSYTVRITTNGDHSIMRPEMDLDRIFSLGASKTGAGAAASVQLVAEVAGVKTNLDPALSITNASPKAWPNDYTNTGRRLVTVSGLNGADDVLTVEVGQ